MSRVRLFRAENLYLRLMSFFSSDMNWICGIAYYSSIRAVHRISSRQQNPRFSTKENGKSHDGVCTHETTMANQNFTSQKPARTLSVLSYQLVNWIH